MGYVVLSKTKRGGHYHIVEGRFKTKTKAKAEARKTRGFQKAGAGGHIWYARVFKRSKRGTSRYYYKPTRKRKR